MRIARILLGLLFAAAPAGAAEPKTKSAEAQILFANQGGIQDWRAHDDEGLYVRDRNGQWYYASLFSTCFGLSTANGIGFVTTPGGGFDRFSAIMVEGNKCPVVSLLKSDPPKAKSKPKKK